MSGFTKRAILQTFQQMLETTPFDKLTVSAVARTAGIGHNTFYYHFEDIYDLLNVWLTELLGQFTEAETEGDWEHNVKALLRTCREHSRIVYHIFNSLSRDRLERYVFSVTDDAFCRYVRQQAGDRALPEAYLSDISKVCRYAVIGFFLEFLWNEMQGDIDENVDKLAGLFSGFVSQALDAAPDR